MIRILSGFFFVIILITKVYGQQTYPYSLTRNCHLIESDKDSIGLYKCNDQQQSCRAFVVFKARRSFNTVRTISKLTFSSPEEVSRLNNVAEYEGLLPVNKKVIVPVNCSCFDQRFSLGSHKPMASTFNDHLGPNMQMKPKKPKKPDVVVYAVIIAGCSVSVLSLALVVVVLIFCRRKRKRPSTLEDLGVQTAGPREFKIEEIRKATNGFGLENQIIGSVYRGVFEHHETVFAVKKTKRDPTNEVSLLKKLNHFNLTKLEGFCRHQDRFFYLVFEYMENGSLREWLMRNDNKCWVKRIEIALDVAHGLNYLHSFTEPGFVHKNVKTSNILLDRDLRAKIANFGLAGPVDDRLTACHVVGTRGYVAPEYLANGVSTTKIDVFAFGVVVSELLSGKKAVCVEDGKHVSLSARIVEIVESGDEGELEVFVDCGLKEDYERFREFGLRVAKLSVACLNIDPMKRPCMSEVVSTLSEILADLHTTRLSAL